MNKIILVSIIKNEEQIIKRCLSNILSIVDGICITDTGSTDNTVGVLNEYFKELDVPAKLYHDEWKNFGHNRTNSFLNGVDFCKELGWDLDKTYGLLLDADMNLVINNFKKEDLILTGYNIIQDNSNLEYYNTRFIRMSFNWKCIGVTHEYWNGEDLGNFPKDKIYINDVGDGGCKSDKIVRDIRLLEEGLVEDPNNGRYYFYLAQSYKDKGDFPKAIKLYKKRIEIGGWYEEIWYSYYMISMCHLLLKNEIKFEAWALKAYNNRNCRAEPIYELVKYFRDKSQHYKAYHYYLIGKKIPYPKDDILFIDKNVYGYCFDYEFTILQYYIFPKDRLDGLKNLINYYNKYPNNGDLTFNNMMYYMNRIIDDGLQFYLDIKNNDQEFKPSSISLLKVKDKILANIRFINYKIEDNGSYTYNGNIKTKNAYMYLNHNCETLSNPVFMDENLDIPKRNTHILGLEDIRLYNLNDKIYFTAISLEYSYTDRNRIVKGEYDIDNKKFKNSVCMIPPIETDCEKNWVMIENKIIYKWYPLEVGILVNNKLEIIYTIDTPTFFNKYRGSTNAFEYNNEYWFVTHGIMNCSPRKYFHQIVILDNQYNVVRYTVPFYFDKFAIEYCIGFIIINDMIYMTSSRNDSKPIIVKIKIKNLEKYFI